MSILGYSLARSKRRVRRLVVAAIGIAFGALGWWAWIDLPELVRRGSLIAIQRKCFAHSLPPDLVVFAADPDAFTYQEPADWLMFLDGYPALYVPGVTPPARHVVYLGERTVADDGGDGSRRRYLLHAGVASADAGVLTIQVECFEEVRWRGEVPGIVHRQTRAVPMEPGMKLFGGQPDPTDRGRFTLRYTSDVGEGVFGFRLRRAGVDGMQIIFDDGEDNPDGGR
jgi:hypothetical protein